MPLTCTDADGDLSRIVPGVHINDRLSTAMFSIVFSDDPNDMRTYRQTYPLTCMYLARSEGFEPPTF